MRRALRAAGRVSARLDKPLVRPNQVRSTLQKKLDLMTNDLEAATRPRPLRSELFELAVPDGWQQGRGAYGGLTLAALVRAIEAYANTPDRLLRSLTAELPGPNLAGRGEIAVESLRVGSGQSTLSARLLQDGELKAHAVAVLGRARASSAGEYCELIPPEQPDWRSLPALARPEGPGFAKHFEYRSASAPPFSGAPSARITGWVRARHCAAMSSAAYLVALADAWWPATFVRATAPMPLGTVAFTLQVIGDPPPLDPAIPLAYRAHVWSLSQGYFVEQRELWTEQGRLLALNQQTFAVIK